MTYKRKIFGSFKVRLTLFFVLSMVLVSALSNFLVYQFSLRIQFQQLREKLTIIAQTAALNIDAEILLNVPLTKEGIGSSEFKQISKQLMRIKNTNPAFAYVYTMKKTDKAGMLQFVVSPDEVPKKEEMQQGLSCYPGDEYDAKLSPELLTAFSKPVADSVLVTDERGFFLSGYAPIYNSKGEAVAILGIDMLANDVYLTRQQVNSRAWIIFGIGVLISVVLGLFMANRIISPVTKLVSATKNIIEGDLDCHVDLSGPDEIRNLANSFNTMATHLKSSKKKLYNYFYFIMQSFVRILETKDEYTKGHSERVAEYAEKIARKLNFDPEQIDTIRDSALLHDIGKLGLDSSLLNKEGALSPAEWKQLKEHPAWGEEIVKPVALNKEMLAVIKGHHERYDGSGYPDELKTETIDLYAAIVSVADAYDAMTSNRAYRQSLGKEKALEELKQNRGTQFHPAVIDAFLSVLEAEIISADIAAPHVVE